MLNKEENDESFNHNNKKNIQLISYYVVFILVSFGIESVLVTLHQLYSNYIELKVTRIYYKAFMKEVGEIELSKRRSLNFFHYEGSENS